MHLDDERIQRLLHGELGPDEAEVRLHLASCAACRGLLEEARVEEGRVFGLLSRVDHPIPALDPRTLLPERESGANRWGRRAAVVLLGAALAGVAYAAPGSPVPAVLERLLGVRLDGQGHAPTVQTDNAPPASPGIAVAPGDGLVIQLVAEGADAVATVALTNDDEVVVRAVEGAASFASDPGHLTVRSSGRARLEVLIPRTATSVEVRSDTVPVFRKQARGPVTTLPRDSRGRYTIPLRATTP
jgi:hypothetical protein